MDETRSISSKKWEIVLQNFKEKNNQKFIDALLDLDLFPIKDSYVAYLKRDRTALQRNPNTINRLASQLYELGIDKLFERCSIPKETNRQIGPLFRRWLKQGTLGFPVLNSIDFVKSSDNAILDASDREAKVWAEKYLNYQRDKGLDFIARINKQYVIGEAKFLTDYGGHQNAQFEDAIATLNTPNVNAIKIAILDGVLYIRPKAQTINKMYKNITSTDNQYILSALVLRNFLYTL